MLSILLRLLRVHEKFTLVLGELYLCIGNQIEQSTSFITFIDLPSDPIFNLIYRHQLPNVKNVYE